MRVRPGWAAAALCALGVAACGAQGTSTSAGGTRGTNSANGSGGPGGPNAIAARAPAGDWLQFGDNAAHTGSGPAATGITAADVAGLQVRTVRIDGVADSAAVEVHGIRAHGSRHDLVAVTTTYGDTVAIDAGTGARLWEYRPRGVNAAPGNPQVTNASPAVDPSRRFVYTASPDGVVHKLSLATGRPMWAQSITFDPHHEKIAGALTVSGPWVVVVTGGYIGDAPPYDAHVVTIDRSSGRIAHVWNSECSNRHALIRAASCGVTDTRGDDAIWGRPGAVIEPGTRRILVATGNGPFDGSTSWGNSVLELTPSASALLHNWTPADQRRLADADADVGSTSPTLLPRFGGRRLAVQGGKAGVLDLLDLDRLDGTTGGAGSRLGGELAQIAAPGGVETLTQPAVWTTHGTTYVFVGSDTATGAYRLVDPGHPHLQRVWEMPDTSTSPVVAGGLLYTYDPTGTLYIRQPATGHVLRAISVPEGHWNSPIVVGGRIILPTGSYHSAAGASAIEIIHLPGR